MKLMDVQRYRLIVNDIAGLDWAALSREELRIAAYAYYFFSVQFREGLELACALNPWDTRLMELRTGEIDTDNLSPFPGIAEPGERMDHDEFMLRIVGISELGERAHTHVGLLGQAYLETTRRLPERTRAIAVASYEDGGLEAVFRAMLTAPDWQHPSLAAFQHFLVEHIRFDSDEGAGHGALSRHLVPDDRVIPLWSAFRDLLIGAVPRLLG
jgi:hypothetical protein